MGNEVLTEVQEEKLQKMMLVAVGRQFNLKSNEDLFAEVIGSSGSADSENRAICPIANVFYPFLAMAHKWKHFGASEEVRLKLVSDIDKILSEKSPDIKFVHGVIKNMKESSGLDISRDICDLLLKECESFEGKGGPSLKLSHSELFELSLKKAVSNELAKLDTRFPGIVFENLHLELWDIVFQCISVYLQLSEIKPTINKSLEVKRTSRKSKGGSKKTKSTEKKPKKTGERSEKAKEGEEEAKEGSKSVADDAEEEAKEGSKSVAEAVDGAEKAEKKNVELVFSKLKLDLSLFKCFPLTVSSAKEFMAIQRLRELEFWSGNLKLKRGAPQEVIDLCINRGIFFEMAL